MAVEKPKLKALEASGLCNSADCIQPVAALVKT